MISGVSDKEYAIIKEILAPFASYEFFFYGSRVRGTQGAVSDLDVLVKGAHEMPLEELETLKELFDESALPYVVNFSDFHKMDNKFYTSIERDLVKVL